DKDNIRFSISGNICQPDLLWTEKDGRSSIHQSSPLRRKKLQPVMIPFLRPAKSFQPFMRGRKLYFTFLQIEEIPVFNLSICPCLS
ncbi:hypothetical protein MXD81_19640, partial [Microbacteriaceae bacterium K1510]|nr:hypothetical protein [Microbacteriaceae bacterium K1510]